MIDLLTFLICRLLGRNCTESRPSSKDLRAEMRTLSDSAEAETQEIRRRRNVIEDAFSPQRKADP